MTKINFGRLFIGGLIASVLLFLSDGFLHENIVKQYWEFLYQGLGTRMPSESHAISLVYFFIFELGRGFLAIFLYVLMRPFHGPGPKTAIIAAIVAWITCSITGPAEFIPLGFYGRRMWLIIAGYQLVTSIVANLLAAWIYRDPATTVTPADAT
ncbi:MAG: hypothetical protein IPM59_01135 [Chloracidobacterium sp.]|nr:hypothetical protein [Chloracidobacterium sp.]